MSRVPRLLSWMGLAGVAVATAHFAFAQAQFGTPYPYFQQPAPRTQLPPPARHVGGLTGNPFQNNRGRPTGLPVGAGTHNFFNPGIGNPVVHQPARKQFSGVSPYRPLITSQEAARLEVARGLWRF